MSRGQLMQGSSIDCYVYFFIKNKFYVFYARNYVVFTLFFM